MLSIVEYLVIFLFCFLASLLAVGSVVTILFFVVKKNIKETMKEQAKKSPLTQMTELLGGLGGLNGMVR